MCFGIQHLPSLASIVFWRWPAWRWRWGWCKQVVGIINRTFTQIHLLIFNLLCFVGARSQVTWNTVVSVGLLVRLVSKKMRLKAHSRLCHEGGKDTIARKGRRDLLRIFQAASFPPSKSSSTSRNSIAAKLLSEVLSSSP